MIYIKHEKDRSTPRELSRLEPPELGRTGEYFIHPHAIRRAFLDELRAIGYRVDTETLAVNRGGARISLGLRLTDETIISDFIYNPTFGLTMGANGRCRITTFSGGVLPNGAVFIVARREAPKFSPYFKITEVAKTLVESFHTDAMQLDRCIRNLKAIYPSAERVTHYLMDAAIKGLIRNKDIKECFRIWNATKEQSAWNLLLAFSLAIKDSSPFIQLDRLFEFSKSLYQKQFPHIIAPAMETYRKRGSKKS